MLVQKYFSFNILKHSAEDRSILGEREVLTLKKIIKLSNFEMPTSKEKTVVDIGCGDMHLKTALVGEGFNYTGLDIEQVDFETGKLPLHDNSVDVIVCLAVIEHIKNPDNLLKEIKRILKNNGYVYFSTPNFKMCFKSFYNDPTHVKPYTPISLQMLFEMYGFVSVQTYPGLRCKPNWYYTGAYRFLKAYWLLPFTGQNKYVPRFLKGRSTSIFLIGKKCE